MSPIILTEERRRLVSPWFTSKKLAKGALMYFSFWCACFQITSNFIGGEGGLYQLPRKWKRVLQKNQQAIAPTQHIGL